MKLSSTVAVVVVANLDSSGAESTKGAESQKDAKIHKGGDEARANSRRLASEELGEYFSIVAVLKEV
jgi:hypothetical protein